MSKFIPNKNKSNYGGQVKPKLKVKVIINDEEQYLNEYDAFTMISEVKQQIAQLSQAVKGIMDAMEAATAEVSEPKVQSTGPTPIKLPKLNKVEQGSLNGGTKFYSYGSDEVNLQS